MARMNDTSRPVPEIMQPMSVVLTGYGKEMLG